MFQLNGEPEMILQGWDSEKKRQVYLFRSRETGKWGYFKGGFCQVPWNAEKKALIDGNWISMAKYHRVHVKFVRAITFTNYVDNKKISDKTNEALIVLTDSAFKSLEEAMKGRSPLSVYSLTYKTRKNNNGKEMTYVDKVVFAGVIKS